MASKAATQALIAWSRKSDDVDTRRKDARRAQERLREAEVSLERISTELLSKLSVDGADSYVAILDSAGTTIIEAARSKDGLVITTKPLAGHAGKDAP